MALLIGFDLCIVVFAIAKDITERKQAEKEIEEKYKKFKSLATHFKSSIEKEGRRNETGCREERDRVRLAGSLLPNRSL